jgi:hypothetical protein
LGCPPPLHAQALARGPLAAIRLHRAVGSGTTRAAVRAGGGAAANAGAHPQPHAGSQDNGNGKLLLTQLDRLHLAFKRSQVSPSASSSSQDQQSQHPPKSVIPTQRRVTEQLTKKWAPFKVLRERYGGTRFSEQRQLHLPQKHKATVADSTLRVEMNGLEEQADNANVSQGPRARPPPSPK